MSREKGEWKRRGNGEVARECREENGMAKEERNWTEAR